tara:strand:- start:4599 stop:4895 length:297 start_codon:yes stop_codon:yes gene_type:complete
VGFFNLTFVVCDIKFFEMETVITKRKKNRSDHIHSKVKNVYKVIIVEHEGEMWEVEECHKLKTNLEDFKISRQGKWRKVDKRKFTANTINDIDCYRTR